MKTRAKQDLYPPNQTKCAVTCASVSVGLVGASVDPAALTTITRIQPSSAWTKGSLHLPRAGTSFYRGEGLWAVEREGADVAETAIELLRVAESSGTTLREYAAAEGASLSVGIWWDPRGVGGFVAPSDIVRRLCALCDTVNVYYPGKD